VILGLVVDRGHGMVREFLAPCRAGILTLLVHVAKDGGGFGVNVVFDGGDCECGPTDEVGMFAIGSWPVWLERMAWPLGWCTLIGVVAGAGF